MVLAPVSRRCFECCLFMPMQSGPAFHAGCQRLRGGLVAHPCLPMGVYRKLDDKSTRFLPQAFGELPQGMNGTSDFSGCYEHARKVLAIDQHINCFIGAWPEGDCGLNNEYNPVLSSDQTFLALRGFYKCARFLTPILRKSGYHEPWMLPDAGICPRNNVHILHRNFSKRRPGLTYPRAVEGYARWISKLSKPTGTRTARYAW